MNSNITKSEIEVRVAEQLAAQSRRGVSLPIELVRGLARAHLEMTAHSRLGENAPPLPTISDQLTAAFPPLPVPVAAVPPRLVVSPVSAAVVADRARCEALIGMTARGTNAEAECREAIRSGISIEEYRPTAAARSILDAIEVLRNR